MLLVHGECDRLTSSPATREFAGKVKGEVTLELLPQCYHETHNDPEKGEVLGTMISWLDQHMPAGESL